MKQQQYYIEAYAVDNMLCNSSRKWTTRLLFCCCTYQDIFFRTKKGEVLRTATTDTYIQMTSVWFVGYIRSRVRETLDALHPSHFVVTTLIYLYSTKCVWRCRHISRVLCASYMQSYLLSLLFPVNWNSACIKNADGKYSKYFKK